MTNDFGWINAFAFNVFLNEKFTPKPNYSKTQPEPSALFQFKLPYLGHVYHHIQNSPNNLPMLTYPTPS